jgi:hypothetical protein
MTGNGEIASIHSMKFNFADVWALFAKTGVAGLRPAQWFRPGKNSPDDQNQNTMRHHGWRTPKSNLK